MGKTHRATSFAREVVRHHPPGDVYTSVICSIQETAS